MTRRDEWLTLTAAALAAGLTPQAARLAADEMLAECDERFPPDGEWRVVGESPASSGVATSGVIYARVSTATGTGKR